MLNTRSLSLSRARWWACVVALLVLDAGAVAYRHLTSPQRIRRQAQRYLADFVTADVSVDAAEFSFFSGIALTGVAVAEPEGVSNVNDGLAARRHNAFYCDNLLLKHDPIRMLFGRLAVAEVVAVNPSCTVIQDTESGRLNLDKLSGYQQVEVEPCTRDDSLHRTCGTATSFSIEPPTVCAISSPR